MKPLLSLPAALLAMALPMTAWAQPPHGLPATPAVEARALFDRALEADRPDEARQAAGILMGVDRRASLLDELTYRLAIAGGSGQAARLLLEAYPFGDGTAVERERLMERLTHLLLSTPAGQAVGSDAGAIAPLRAPLDTPQLRSRQATFWAERGECGAVLEILSDLAPEYAHGDLVRLANCARNEAPDLAVRALQRAAALDSGDAAVHMELGYAYWHQARLREAASAFERAWEIDGASATAEQLVYVHQRLHENGTARYYAEQALETRASSVAPQSGADADHRFRLRRLHEDLGRRVTVSLDGWSGPRMGIGTGSPEAGRAYSSYSQFEVDYRLGRQPVRNNTTVSVFTRLMSDAGNAQSPLPSHNPTLGVGLRWKPFRNQVLYFSGEAQTTLEHDRRQDLLLRASASFLNEAHNDDWHASGAGWFAQNLYMDAAHYVEAQRSGVTVDYRAGYHRKTGGSHTVEPYAHLQVSGLYTDGLQQDLRGGAGMRWNLWYGAGRYHAPRHKLSLGVELQQAIDTYLPDRRGVFFTLGSRW